MHKIKLSLAWPARGWKGVSVLELKSSKGEGIQEIISLECTTSPFLFNLPLWRSANIHLRSAISNATRSLQLQCYRTKVYLAFMCPTLSPGVVMNITPWFTEKLKMLAASIHHPTPCVVPGGRKTSWKAFVCVWVSGNIHSVFLFFCSVSSHMLLIYFIFCNGNNKSPFSLSLRDVCHQTNNHYSM